jgi:hypothetical protein
MIARNWLMKALKLPLMAPPRGSRALLLLQACTYRKIHQPGRFCMLFARLLRPFMTIGTLRIVDAGGACAHD